MRFSVFVFVADWLVDPTVVQLQLCVMQRNPICADGRKNLQSAG
jgi:hypothetical protein